MVHTIPLYPRNAALPAAPTGPDVLMNILSLQKAEGGFEIDRALSRRMGITITELKKLSNKIKAIEKADMLTLLSTAIILQLLNQYYSGREDEWKDLAEKTDRWFRNEVSSKYQIIFDIPLIITELNIVLFHLRHLRNS